MGIEEEEEEEEDGNNRRSQNEEGNPARFILFLRTLLHFQKKQWGWKRRGVETSGIRLCKCRLPLVFDLIAKLTLIESEIIQVHQVF